MIYAVLEGIPDRVLGLEDDCETLELPIVPGWSDNLRAEQMIDLMTGELHDTGGSQIPVETFKRTTVTMNVCGRECIIFMRSL